jgi:hypothetical protein
MSRTAALLVAIIAAAALVAAQQARGPQSKTGGPGSSSSKSTPSSTPNRPNARIGNDIVQVVDRLIAAGATKGKGEFETTEEYDSRRKGVAGLFGQLTFLLPRNSGFDSTPFAYDADQAQMQVHLRAMREYFHSDDDLTEVKAILLASSGTRTATTFRTGANGRRIRIDTLSEYGIIISPQSPLPFASEEPYFNNVLPSTATYGFPLSIAQARIVKPFLRVVIVGRLDEGRVYKESDTDPHFGDYSYDLKRDRFYIHFSVDEIQVVDVRTGERLHVIRPSEEGQ